jgi:hypothetical protein
MNHITPRERALTTDERLGRIDERLERLEHELLGNGQPGVVQRIEARLRSLEGWRSMLLGAWFLLTSVVAIYAAVKK